MDTWPIEVTVNGRPYAREVESRLTLADFLRHDLALTGTHVGCEHGVCGTCTVLLDGRSVRSCLLFAVQADRHSLTTVEGLAGESTLHPVQEALWTHHGLQCGFCTPGILMTLVELLRESPAPTEGEVRVALAGHLCRCTGYESIVVAALAAANRLQAAAASP